MPCNKFMEINFTFRQGTLDDLTGFSRPYL
jgi:hypothetical protein